MSSNYSVPNLIITILCIAVSFHHEIFNQIINFIMSILSKETLHLYFSPSEYVIPYFHSSLSRSSIVHVPNVSTGVPKVLAPKVEASTFQILPGLWMFWISGLRGTNFVRNLYVESQTTYRKYTTKGIILICLSLLTIQI